MNARDARKLVEAYKPDVDEHEVEIDRQIRDKAEKGYTYLEYHSETDSLRDDEIECLIDIYQGKGFSANISSFYMMAGLTISWHIKEDKPKEEAEPYIKSNEPTFYYKEDKIKTKRERIWEILTED